MIHNLLWMQYGILESTLETKHLLLSLYHVQSSAFHCISLKKQRLLKFYLEIKEKKNWREKTKNEERMKKNPKK